MAKKKNKKIKNKEAGTTTATYKAPVSKKSVQTVNDHILFDKDHIKIFLIGLAIIFVGILLMSGGSMPSPDVWDENIIYSTRRTVIAPILILVGLGVQVYGILKRN